MTMDDIGVLVRFEHELKSGPREKSEPFGIVPVTIVYAALKEPSIGVRIYEKTFPAMNEAEKNGAMHPPVVKRHPQVAIRFLEAVNLVVSHAVVFWEYDLDGVASDFEFVREPVYYIPEASDLCHRSALRGYEDDKQVSPLKEDLLKKPDIRDSNTLYSQLP